MDSKSAATVYYSRRTLITWSLSAAATVAFAAGLVFIATGKKHAAQIDLLTEQVRLLSAESAKLRAANGEIEKRAAALKLRLGKAPPKEKSTPVIAPIVEERGFPLSEAVEIVPDRVFITLSRLDGERARIRIAGIDGGETSNRSRALQPGQTWRFTAGGDSYALLFHSITGAPPEARLSIRKLGDRKLDNRKPGNLKPRK